MEGAGGRASLAIETSSPVVLNGVIYTGVASLEEGVAANPQYPCCSFRGSARDQCEDRQGDLENLPAPHGYSGVGIWGSSVVPDLLRGVVYITTGNNYSTLKAPEFKSVHERAIAHGRRRHRSASRTTTTSTPLSRSA